MTMTKAYSRFITVLFCGFIGGMFLLSIILPDRERSETENRLLAQWPEFSWESLKSGEFTSGVEEYIADQFPLRDGWTGLKSRVEQLIGKTEFNGVYLAGDTLISKVEKPDDERLDKNFGYIQKLDGKTEATVHLGLIPSAAEIWRDRLPNGAYSWDQTLLLKMAEETGLNTVDFLSVLQKYADEQIFYRTDHHWTSTGAYFGYTAIMEALGRGNEIIPADKYTPERVSRDFNGTLYSSSGIHWLKPDAIEYWVKEDGLTVTSWRTGKEESALLYDRSYLSVKDKYSSFLGGNQPLCVIKNENAAGGKLLIVRDSYADSVAPFLAQHFSEVHLMDLRYYRSSVAQYADQNGIDDVLVMYSVPNFTTDVNMVFMGA